MRPKSAGEAARIIGVLSDARQNALRRVEELLGAHRDERVIQQEVLLTVREVVVGLWGEESANELWEAFTAHQAQAEGVETVPVVSAEDVSVGEDDEDNDE
jgi:broad specificity phosphatase PhoE